MKNIVIVEIPQSGECCFSKMIVNKHKEYNLIQEHIVSYAHIKALATVEKAKTESDEGINMTIDIYYMKELMKELFNFSVSRQNESCFILESYTMELEEAKQFQDEGNIVLVLGYPNTTVEKCIEEFGEIETGDEWFDQETEKELPRMFNDYIKQSKEYEQKCRELGLKFIDVSKNSEQVLEQTLEWLDSEIIKRDI